MWAPAERLPRSDEERCHLVVLVSHLGFAQDVALVREIDGVDVVLSGHTHNRLEQPAEVGGVLITQSSFSGSFLGRLDLEVEQGRVAAWHHQFIALEESIEADATVQAAIDALRRHLGSVESVAPEVTGRTFIAQ